MVQVGLPNLKKCQYKIVNMGHIKADEHGSKYNLWNEKIALNCNCAKWQPLFSSDN